MPLQKWPDMQSKLLPHFWPTLHAEQPVLPPGASFDYTSFCELKTPVGSMHGSYQMVTASGDRFDAVIAPFTLAIPHALN